MDNDSEAEDGANAPGDDQRVINEAEGIANYAALARGTTDLNMESDDLHVGKGSRPSGSDQERTLINRSNEALREIISEQRVFTRRNLATASYLPSLRLAQVHTTQGSLFNTVGRTVAGTTWLLPEECLFLLETGRLTVDLAAVSSLEASSTTAKSLAPTVSMQQAYGLMVDPDSATSELQVRSSTPALTFSQYQVYSHLKRLGFAVFRSDADSLYPKKLNRSPKHRAQSKNVGWWRSLTDWLSTIATCVWIKTKSYLQAFFLSPSSFRLSFYSSCVGWRLLSTSLAIGRASMPEKVIHPLPCHFLVYRASQGFRKSAPGQPDFVVHVRTSFDPHILRLLSQHLPSSSVPPTFPPASAPVLRHPRVVLAVVSSGNVSFFSLDGGDVVTSRLAKGGKKGKKSQLKQEIILLGQLM
ncbi:hypothetical protein M427DRAFT_130775 [Gonapodya prolifera JEL478]|uniref:tRNA-splicing endonuclease subunit Sen54 N-terminal domain-containing protein n=1 Tax=Gonapodya prolifera (strain JEL478) TaxID=1344416 RepID=A0A139AWZ2_GONPJ|nr:hypothetical protein M427DRAFT_130775 [Gonapodya prolifera JEL478]|eukprot:KXS21238.1 hypothetical protein M427DRAFT_130775 [Gonapodya prolifera JEL478]